MQRLWILLTLWAALLASCGAPRPSSDATTAPGATPTRGSETVTISFAVWEYERDAYQTLADRFTTEHPDIKVVLVSLDDTLVDESGNYESINPLNFLRRIVSAADTAPSSYWLTPEAFGTPLLLDLKPLMDADPSFQRNDFLPGTLERYTAKGGIWALPRSYSVPLIIYNRTLFQNANLPEPRPGWTWDDLLAAAERLTERSGSTILTYGFLEPSGGALTLMSLLEKQGINPLTASAAEVDLTAPEYVAALERIQEWRRTGVLIEPYSHGASAEDPTRLVREGRVAIWSDMFYISNDDGSPWTPDFPVGRAPFPKGSFYDPFFSSTEGFIISGGTAHPAAAWRWIEWLSRQPVAEDQQSFVPFSRLPARQSVAQQTEFWNKLDPQTAEAYRWAIANSGTLPSSQFDYTVISALSQAVSKITSDPKANVRQVLADAQRQLRESIAQRELTPTPKPNLNPVVVATPEPQEAPVGATTVTFGTYGYDPAQMRRIARAFREQRPDIFVQLKQFEWTPEMQEATAATLAQTNDCFFWFGPLSRNDEAALLDLRPLIEADPTFPRDDIFPAALAQYSREGRIYGLPYSINMRTLVYNHAAFEAAGVQPPRAEWKPSDFLAAAQALTRGEGNDQRWGYVPLGGPQADLLFFISQFGARLVVGEGKDLRPNYIDPKTIAAIRWYLDLSIVHKVSPPLKFYYKRDDVSGQDRSYELAQSGRVGMWFGYAETFQEGVITQPIAPEGGPALPTAVPLTPVERDIRAAPLPVGAAGVPPSELFLRGLFISARAQQPQACWEWIKFLSSDTSLMYSDMPARRSIAQSETFLKQIPPERAAQFEAIRATLAIPSQNVNDQNAFYGQYSDPYWFFKALSAVVEKGANLEKELAEAQRFATAFAECMNRANARAPACAKEVDPDYKGFNVEEEEMRPLPAGYAP
ncbi:MAG: extracellular solute-binding protein [Roseiflexus sp.]|nr:extracellular solute-binding protein [Roseiflexus sp.]MCS7288718.1 extracellular solute-binding protein [Roseiflexus sp.]MDW8232778.1 extracellular solute-binding protein [Roseiflexaceae bacterium]